MMEFVPQDNVNVKNLKTFFFFFQKWKYSDLWNESIKGKLEAI